MLNGGLPSSVKATNRPVPWCELRLQKVDVIEDLVDPFFGKRVQLADQALAEDVVH